MGLEEFLKILKRIAGVELEEGEVYDEVFAGNEINRAAKTYEELLKDRDRIRQQYINDFTKTVDEEPEVETETEEEEKKIELEDFLNI